MSDLVVTVLQLSCRSSGDDPAQSLAVGLPALGGGIFSQALGDEFSHTHQIPIFNLEEETPHENFNNFAHLDTKKEA